MTSFISDDRLSCVTNPDNHDAETPQYAYRLNIDNGVDFDQNYDTPYTYDECVSLVKNEMYKPDSAENISIERYMLNGDEIISVYDFNRAKWFEIALRYLDLCDLRELVGLSSDQVVQMNELKKYLDFKKE